MKILFTIHFAPVDGSNSEQKHVVADSLYQAYLSVPENRKSDIVAITTGPSVEVL